MSKKYIALIPAYEPSRILIDLILQLRSKGFEIIVVDDGSGTNYSGLFLNLSYNAVLLTHTKNKGKGSALKTGLAYIDKNLTNDSIIVTIDADGQHRVEDAIKLCILAEQHPNAMVLGGRRLKENVPLRSKLGSTITRLVYRLSTGLKVNDTQTGLRAFNIKLIPELLNISGERYEYEMNVLLEFAHRHIPILETEVETIYLNNNAASHFDTMRDSYRIYKEILKFSAASFIGFLVDYFIYSLLLLFAANLRVANIGARGVSAAANYTLNRKLVFKSRENITKSAVQYFALAAVILFANTILLEALVNYYNMNRMLSKLLTEMLFFLISWCIQRYIIFSKRREVSV